MWSLECKTKELCMGAEWDLQDFIFSPKRDWCKCLKNMIQVEIEINDIFRIKKIHGKTQRIYYLTGESVIIWMDSTFEH